MKNLLHIGCGLQNISSLPLWFQKTSWDETRMDIDPSVDPDIIGRLQDLSLIEDSVFDAVYSSHNIEHVSSYEVQPILNEFNRILKSKGFAMILCPDIQSVAEAILQKNSLEEALYSAPAGPINAMDIIYGYQSDIQKGNIFMAHKAAFTMKSLIEKIMTAEFSHAFVARDKFYGLHGVAFKEDWNEYEIKAMISFLLPPPHVILETEWVIR
jgi:predicted SAM-dependent methyltransferase